MSDQDMFKTPEEPNKEVPKGDSSDTTGQEITPDPMKALADQLQGIQNEDGKPKYESLPKALDALGHSQKHIGTLEDENSQLKNEIESLKVEAAKGQSVDEVMERLAALNKDEPKKETPQVNSLDEDAVKALVQNALVEQARGNQAEDNLKSVMGSLSQTYGDKANEVVASKATEMNTTPEEIGKLAKQNPKLVLALFKEGGGSAGPTTSTVNIPNKPKVEEGLPKPSKSLLSGATTKDMVEHMRAVKAAVNDQLGVET